MKVKARFEKHELRVGLSAELPLVYRGPEEKYSLADWLSRNLTAHINYEKNTFEFELEATSDEFVQSPDRARCYLLINVMPEAALPEVEEELQETCEHYLALNEAEQKARLLPVAKQVIATVVDHVKT